MAYQNALKLDKDFADAKYNLAFALSSQKRYKEAIPQFQDLHQASPKDATLYDGLGEAYENTNDIKNAIANYNLAIQNDPKNAFYQLRMALLLVNQDARQRPSSICARPSRSTRRTPKPFCTWATSLSA